MNGYSTADYTWDFTDQNTIDLNRAGQMTPRQQDLLQRFTPSPYTGCFYIFILAPLFAGPLWISTQAGLPSFVLPLFLLIFWGLGLLILGYGLFFGWRAWNTRQEIRDGKIVGGHGQVFRTSKGYNARVGKKMLRTFALNKVDLLPGNYYFFFLPRSGFLLSAESLEANDLLGAAELTKDLGSHFHFNDNDLNLNQTGHLSGRQRFRLLLQASFFGFLLLILLIVGPLFIYLILQNEDFDLLSIQTGGMVLLFLAFVGWVGHSFLPRVIDAVLGTSRTITGPVQPQYRSAGRSTELYYVVSGQSFKVGLNDYFALIEGLIYHVHYTRWSKRIMSIEAVPITGVQR